MISVKYALIMAVGAFAAGSFFASPLPEAIASTIANDVICSGCVGTSDLAGNAVTAAKIKDGEVKAAEIATNAVGSSEIAANAVGASEIQGVTKLIFQKCVLSEAQRSTSIGPGTGLGITCFLPGAASGDSAIVSLYSPVECFAVTSVQPGTDTIEVDFVNSCNQIANAGIGSYLSIVVYTNFIT